MSNDYYIYVYLDPRKSGIFNYGALSFSYEPFYVGKGKGDRWASHIREITNSWKPRQSHHHKYNKIKKILSEGFMPIVQKLLSNLEEKEAYLREEEIIKLIGKEVDKTGPLTNILDSNEFGLISEEVRKRAVQTRKENNNYVMSEEQKEKIRQAHLGKTLTPEHVQHIIEARKGYRHSEETKKKISTFQNKDLHAKITKESWQDPVVARARKDGISLAYKEKRKKGIKSYWINNGTQQGRYEEDKVIKLIKEGWVYGRLPIVALQGRSLSEETKQKMRETAAQPENKLRRSKNSSKNWTEEYRVKRLQSLQETCATRTLRKKVWVHKDTSAILVYHEELEKFITQGYELGRGEGLKKRGEQGKSLWINNGTESKMLREDKALLLLNQGWSRGRLSLKKEN